MPLSRAVQATWLEFHPKNLPLGKVEGGKFLEKENEQPVRIRLRRKKWCQILRRDGWLGTMQEGDSNGREVHYI